MNSKPTIGISDPGGLGEVPNASIMALARLVCEHGTVIWLAFGPPNIGVLSDPTGRPKPAACRCIPTMAAIYPESSGG